MGQGLLAIGLTTLDMVARPIDALPVGEGTRLVDGIAVAPAGTAAGAAMVAARLGVKTRLAGGIGADFMGRVVRMGLEEQGIDTSLLAVLDGYPTSATVLTIDSHGRRPNFHALGAGLFAPTDEAVIAAAGDCRFLHYAAIGGPGADGGPGLAVVQAAKAGGATVTCDLISPQPSALAELERLLPHVDYFMPSVSEAFALSKTDSLEAAASFFLGLGAAAVLIKNGGAGSYVALGSERNALPAYDITPLDTTSCGDSYCAGFIAALDRGLAPLEAARFATAVAALVAQGLATLGRLESYEGVLEAMTTMTLKDAA
ncbi:carbohydrate kinase family protein [Phenylobacterium sp.]|uniref:carbohydrate kinase family protein n=1 Tax=Phenylobacterium sp. TaxID=1871053 RepID=UPI0035AE18A9